MAYGDCRIRILLQDIFCCNSISDLLLILVIHKCCQREFLKILQNRINGISEAVVDGYKFVTVSISVLLYDGIEFFKALSDLINLLFRNCDPLLSCNTP